ncbi:hypothetical protein CRUP_002648 [Coryphaenoides rupestris]|nr:hypothetical protein CRUP_002648 [Coryphaenoides rupestris]
MTMKWASLCLLAVALSCLADAQSYKKPQAPQTEWPQSPGAQTKPQWQAPAPPAPQVPQNPKQWQPPVPPAPQVPQTKPQWQAPAPAPPQVPQTKPPPRPVPQNPKQTWQPPAPPKYTPPNQNFLPPAPPKYTPSRPQTSQPTQTQQNAKQHPAQDPTPEFQSCEVAASYKIKCGPQDITPAGCKLITCCHDGNMCYYGKAVTVQCTKDAQFIVVVARDATLPNIDIETVSLLGTGPGCTPVGTNSAFAVYQFPVTACGTVRTCRYIGTSVEALVIEVNLVPPPPPVAALGPIRVELQLANGQCTQKGCREDEVAFNSFYTEGDYPVVKVLRDPIYVEIRLLERTDPNLVLTLGRCWTTTTPNPYSLPQWDLLVHGCPYRNDRYQTAMIAVSDVELPTHRKRFVFKMFTFVDQGTRIPMKEKGEMPA